MKSSCILLLVFPLMTCVSISNKINWSGSEADNIYYVPNYSKHFYNDIIYFDKFSNQVENMVLSRQKYFDKEYAYVLIDIHQNTISFKIFNHKGDFYFSEMLCYKNNFIDEIEMKVFDWKFIAKYADENNGINENIKWFSPDNILLSERNYIIKDRNVNGREFLNSSYHEKYDYYRKIYTDLVKDFGKKSGFEWGIEYGVDGF